MINEEQSEFLSQLRLIVLLRARAYNLDTFNYIRYCTVTHV